MGYSCTRDASLALTRIEAAATEKHKQRMSGLVCDEKGNVLGFAERGRENADGAITGKVMRFCEPFDPNAQSSFAKPAGSFRIEPDGKVTRFPLMARSVLKRAETITEREVYSITRGKGGIL